MLSSIQFLRVSSRIALPHGPCLRGMSSSAAAVKAASVSTGTSTATAAASDSPQIRTRPNVVPLSELKVDKPYTDEQFARCIRPYYDQRMPVKLSTQHNSFTYNSTAYAKWSSMDYLREAIGPEYPCDVESMTSSVVRERMTLDFHEYSNYLEMAKEHFDLINPGTKFEEEEIMYMAQNDIPPALLPDVSIPGFCSDPQYQMGEGKLYNTMIWIGPRDCVSRLHYDPLDNIFLQIIGTKRVFLIDPTVDADLLYVDTSVYQQNNMSSITHMDDELELLSQDPTTMTKEWRTQATPKITESQYPKLLQVPTIYETKLYPGDVLFIPSKWWHTVRSLEYSISVNAWWR